MKSQHQSEKLKSLKSKYSELMAKIKKGNLTYKEAVKADKETDRLEFLIDEIYLLNALK